VDIKTLIVAVKAKQPNTISLLTQWVRQLQLTENPHCTPLNSFHEALAYLSDQPELAQWLQTIEQTLYSGTEVSWSDRKLEQLEQALILVKNSRKEHKQQTSKNQHLPNFYPQSDLKNDRAKG
jgi:hypothetical protein